MKRNALAESFGNVFLVPLWGQVGEIGLGICIGYSQSSVIYSVGTPTHYRNRDGYQNARERPRDLRAACIEISLDSGYLKSPICFVAHAN
jgi:hypothetical protein